MSYTELKRISHVAHKKHTCIWCGQSINIAEKYTYIIGTYYGDFQQQHWHPECVEAGGKYFKESGGCEFDPWDNERPAKENP